MPTRKPYAATAVPAERSMGAIIDLLRARKIDSRWTTLIGPPEGMILQMIWKHDGSQIRARIEVKIAVPTTRAIPKQRYRHLTPAARRGAPSTRELTEKQKKTAAEAERKRVLRVLAWWLKTQFEAVDAGVLTLVQVMLPFLEVGQHEGSPTVSEVIARRLPELGNGALARALASGK